MNRTKRNKKIEKICICILFLGVTLQMLTQTSGEKLSVKTNSDTQWWAGIIRDGFKERILILARKAAKTGEPIVRSMEYVFPHKGYSKISDQFMLGDKILVAPYTKAGNGTPVVVLPKGKWKADTDKIYRGNKKITVQLPLDRLPWFVKSK